LLAKKENYLYVLKSFLFRTYHLHCNEASDLYVRL